MTRFTCEDISFKANEAVLEGTLCLPSGHERSPAILLVSGSGANDRDETVCGHKPFRVMADHFASLGYAVLRYDERGVGASTGDASAQDFNGSVEDVLDAHRFLSNHAAIRPDAITLIGHSEGGLVAAVASGHAACKAVVMLAAPATPIKELLHHQAEWQSRTAGATARQIAHERQMNEEVFNTLSSPHGSTPVVKGVLLRYLESWPDAAASTAAERSRDAGIMATIVCAPAYRTLLAQSPAEILGRVRCPLLALHGDTDRQVPGVENAQAFLDSTTQNPNARSVLLPHFNHLFQPTSDGSIEEYEALPAGPDPVALDIIHSWLASLA